MRYDHPPSVAVLDAYAEHLGIPRGPAIEPDEDRPAWDGHTMPVWASPDDMAHELAHWILATPDERHLVDYGWGWDWQWFPDDYDGDERVDPDAEYRACVLGFSLMVRAGFPADRMHDVWSDYGFYEHHAYDDDRPWRLGSEAYGLRRAVQPAVAEFMEWRTASSDG